VKKEVLRYKPLGVVPLFVLFILFYIVSAIGFSLLNEFFNLGIGPFIVKLIIFYIILMYLLRVQLHSYEFSLQNKQLMIKEFVAKREKVLAVIPFDMIVSITEEKQHEDKYYHKRKKFIKRHIKNTQMFYIEYDDYTDISLIKIQISSEFYTLLRQMH